MPLAILFILFTLVNITAADGSFELMYVSANSASFVSSHRLAIADTWQNEGGAALYPDWNINTTVNQNWYLKWPAAKSGSAIFKCLQGRPVDCNCAKVWRLPGVVSVMYADAMFAFQQECEINGVVHVTAAIGGLATSLTDYPNLVKAAVTGTAITVAEIRLAQSFGWKRVTYVVGQSIGSPRAQVYETELAARGMRSDFGAIAANIADFTKSLTVIKQTGTKIILTSMSDVETAYFLTAAKTLGMLNGEYAILCADSAWAGTVQQFIKVDNPNDYIKGIVGIRPAIGVGPEFDKWLKRWNTLNTTLYPGAGSAVGFWQTSIYDGTRLLMRGIIDMLKNGENIYNSTILMSRIMAQNFTGITGDITFDRLGNRKGSYDIVFYDQNANLSIAGFTADDKPIMFNNNPIVWIGGTTNVPVDVLPPTRTYINKSLVTFFYAFTGVLIFISLALLAIVTLKKNIVIIQHSGYFYLSMILIGVTGLLSSVYIFGVDMEWISQSRMDDLCMLQVWFVGIFFILLFSPLFLKSVRILWITRYPTINMASHMDKKIALIIGISLIIEIIILAVWTAQDPLRVVTEYKSPSEVYFFCESESIGYPIAWLIYKGILMCFGIIIGFMTRNLDRRFNESKIIAFSIYNTFIICAIVVPLSFIQKEPNIHFIIKCIGVIGIAFGCCAMIFINKLIALLLHTSKSGTSATVDSNSNSAKKSFE